MTGAALYWRFMVSLAFGLVGLGLVLKVLMDKLFNDWDLFSELGRAVSDFWNGRRLVKLDRPEDILASRVEKTRELTTRLVDQRREQLRAMSEVEQRLNKPGSPEPAYVEGWTN